ncbi:hypothetical protein E0493_18460 [Roseomonas sp. M0104]|uniref:Uncharacterized protein n=1 Tax=Teichococcus coralli TaxID=2545983 RepID=A0A845BH04_9PROT|nr:hypothetical protein [Pseudoroseomonas coralli]MXP65334.1 hypothetical protein [Pseudoroseomonas coralli]
MAEEEFRLLRCALALGQFEVRQLGEVAEVSENTAQSWVKRNRRLLVNDGPGEERAGGRPPSGTQRGRGRPRKCWRLAPGAAEQIEARLDGLFPTISRAGVENPRSTGHEEIILRAETAVRNWRATRRGDRDGEARMLRMAAEAAVRTAWEDLAELHQATAVVPQALVQELARVEAELGKGEVPEEPSLPEESIWLANRFEQMVEWLDLRFGGVALGERADRFVGSVLVARARQRERRPLLTAAALAGTVWSDEGLAERGCSPDFLRRCAVLTDLVPPAETLRDVTLAIERRPGRGLCADMQEIQAVVLGLTDRPWCARQVEACNWLWKLRVTNEWDAHLSPPVLRGLLAAPDVQLNHVFDLLDGSLRVAVQDPLSLARPGRLRASAYRKCQDMLTRFGALGGAALGTLSGERVLASFAMRRAPHPAAMAEARP